ncbi:predicted protein [Naegleria gruberi]|uniref:Predicted protein n=1 Tax=Naegleria gruberi TaxID=5762 RepID=D2V916_NAEGR|nr:uncharacterized protein NAEGRDRAFT_47639 [Naegleria gruberi]EFC46898.1 predicted protein [Naegleria gruberi]|eukprot:XP_002679642.1 predicted protein [Naegleria gruberi strain NEG-M]
MPNAIIDRLVEGNRCGERDVVLLDAEDMKTVASAASKIISITNNKTVKIVNIDKENITSEEDVFNCFEKALDSDFQKFWDGFFTMLRNYHEDDLSYVLVNVVSIPVLEREDEELNEQLVSTFFKILLDVKEEKDDDESVQLLITAPREDADRVSYLCEDHGGQLYDKNSNPIQLP